MTDIEEILEKNFSKLKKYLNVLNIQVGEEIAQGVKTGKKAIIVYVSRKLTKSQLKKKDILPDEIENVPVDVVELKSDYQLGETSVSKLPPNIQKRIASGVKKNGK